MTVRFTIVRNASLRATRNFSELVSVSFHGNYARHNVIGDCQPETYENVAKNTC